MRTAAALAAVCFAAALLAWWAASRRPAPGAPGPVELAVPAPAFPGLHKAVPMSEPLPGRAAEPSAPAPAAARPDAAPAAAAAAKTGSAPDAAAQLKILEDILTSKNDNDPRLDRDLKKLSPQAKLLFRQRYSKLPKERRNGRGTIVFLLARETAAPEDWAFLRQVVSEPPCLSLDDCSQAAGFTGPKHEFGGDVTLAYPQLVALDRAERIMEQSGRSSAAGRAALGVIQAARASQDPLVARKAAELSGAP